LSAYDQSQVKMPLTIRSYWSGSKIFIHMRWRSSPRRTEHCPSRLPCGLSVLELVPTWKFKYFPVIEPPDMEKLKRDA
jgi:hypothetical protein